MPQTDSCVVSPTDPDPRRRPDGYVTVLREAGAHEKTIPYRVGWVRRFFARFPGRRRRDLGRAEVETSLSETAAHPGVSNWHVRQARDALELYCAKFRGIPLEPRNAVTEANHSNRPPDTTIVNAHIQNMSAFYTKTNSDVKEKGGWTYPSFSA